jgi:hypothetical protein
MTILFADMATLAVSAAIVFSWIWLASLIVIGGTHKIDDP